MADERHILITGGRGQLGLALARADWPQGVVLHAPGRDALDLADSTSIREVLGSRRWSAIVNSGAYTAVDQAEADLAKAFLVNGQAPAVLAEGARQLGIPLVQVSTDYVFDGGKQGAYEEGDPVAPLGAYGASKLAGELAVRAAGARHVILRTAWVISADRANFLKTMLRLAATRAEVGVVADQKGCPSSTTDIAAALVTITVRLMDDAEAPTGTYHFVNAGEASWADLAREIFEYSASRGGPSAKVRDITTSDYPTPARRPANSVLSTEKIGRDYGIRPKPWRQATALIIDSLMEEQRG